MAHKNLSHLTEQQIKELINRYYNNEKIADLLKEFEINVSAGVLVSLFPPVTHNELFCKYCQDINLISKRESRSHSNYYNKLVFYPFCPVCNHKDNSDCSCSNCKEIIKQKRQAEEEDKRNMLMQAFLPVNIDIPAPNELTLKDAVYLFAVKEHSATKDLEFIKPYLEGPSIPRLAPDEYLINDIVNHLNCRGFIRINPLTNSLDAFKFNTENKLVGYYQNKLLWELLPSMDIEEKQQYLDSVINVVKFKWPSSWGNEVIEMWQLIAKYECMEDFKRSLVKHKFPSMDQYEEKAILESFIDLLQIFSVGQIFNLSWQAVRDVQYYTSLEDNKYDKNNIVSIIINKLQRKAYKAYKAYIEDWTIKNSIREYRLPQTVLSSVFFNVFLELGEEYYELVMPAEYNK